VAEPRPLPTFVIIGAQKSATRWLRLNLGHHPDVYTTPEEVAFFSAATRYRQGPEWYAPHFPGWKGEPIVGEATPGYMMWRHDPGKVSRRIKRFDPDMKLIAVLRNPIDRTYSAFVHHMRRGRIPPDTELLDYVRSVRPHDDPLGLIAGGWYFASLRPFRKRFGDNLLVLLHDDVKSDPVEVYRTALRHIGAEPGFLPPDLQEVRFNNTPPAASKLRAEDGGYKPLTERQRGELFGYFRDDMRKLQFMLKRDLEMWRPSLAGRQHAGDPLARYES
jgi:hypothetical protein